MAALNGSQRNGRPTSSISGNENEKRTYVHALVALARRFVDVVWALLVSQRQ